MYSILGPYPPELNARYLWQPSNPQTIFEVWTSSQTAACPLCCVLSCPESVYRRIWGSKNPELRTQSGSASQHTRHPPGNLDSMFLCINFDAVRADIAMTNTRTGGVSPQRSCACPNVSLYYCHSITRSAGRRAQGRNRVEIDSRCFGLKRESAPYQGTDPNGTTNTMTFSGLGSNQGSKLHRGGEC